MSTNVELSNIALLGSDMELQVRKAAADFEAAFEGAGSEVGVEIWRVENLGVNRWPKEQFGKLFSGDSYIVLNSYKSGSSDKMLYNVHFWLGRNTTQDEAGVAAYKTVELDDKLGTLPVQYREVEGFESEEFLALFKPALVTMDGGIDSGFDHVAPTEYQPRLLHVKGRRKFLRVQQVPLSLQSLNDGDVFILDNGLQLFQWNGSSAGVFEKRRANEVVSAIREDRQCRPSFRVLDGDEDCDEFWSVLGGKGPVKSAAEGGCDDKVGDDDEHTTPKRLMRLSDASGTLSMTEVCSGKVSAGDLDTNDVFLLDNGGVSLFVWVGAGSSKNERAKAFKYANQYIVENNLPLTIPVSRVLEGHTSPAFEHAFA